MEQALNKEDSVSLRGFIKKEPRSVMDMKWARNKIINPVSNDFPLVLRNNGDFFNVKHNLWFRSKDKCNNEN